MAQTQEKKPNILIIWGDDVGMWNINTYHRGMMGGSCDCQPLEEAYETNDYLDS